MQKYKKGISTILYFDFFYLGLNCMREKGEKKTQKIWYGLLVIKIKLKIKNKNYKKQRTNSWMFNFVEIPLNQTTTFLKLLKFFLSIIQRYIKI